MSREARTILITGAGSGIGRDAAFALARRGHRVIAATLTQAQADALQGECSAQGVAMQTLKMDITLPEDRAQILDLPLDVLLNNAGVGESGSLAEVGMQRVRAAFEVNLFATLELTQLALRGMIARRRGTVLFVSSIAGRIPMPFLMPYSMTKFALSAAGAGLRAELDQLRCNVHVALIEPGAIHTGFNQAMTERKYAWMDASSYFHAQAAQMRARERRVFALLEARDTRAIVAQIVRACEARRPKLRYVAPWAQGLMVRLARMLGV
ncbi:MAG: SDR family NAD(P)-dependent oxidoreductase [Rhodoferax sp.]|nr:SDR family NAD(P)-dependent oxidoreductase [Rhodoferax sp.]